MSPNFRTFNELFEYKKNPHTALLFNIVKDMITILIIWCLFRLFGYLVFGIDKLLPIRTLPEDMKLPPFSTSNVYFIVTSYVTIGIIILSGIENFIKYIIKTVSELRKLFTRGTIN